MERQREDEINEMIDEMDVGEDVKNALRAKTSVIAKQQIQLEKDNEIKVNEVLSRKLDTNPAICFSMGESKKKPRDFVTVDYVHNYTHKGDLEAYNNYINDIYDVHNDEYGKLTECLMQPFTKIMDGIAELLLRCESSRVLSHISGLYTLYMFYNDECLTIKTRDAVSKGNVQGIFLGFYMPQLRYMLLESHKAALIDMDSQCFSAITSLPGYTSMIDEQLYEGEKKSLNGRCLMPNDTFARIWLSKLCGDNIIRHFNMAVSILALRKELNTDRGVYEDWMKMFEMSDSPASQRSGFDVEHDELANASVYAKLRDEWNVSVCKKIGPTYKDQPDDLVKIESGTATIYNYKLDSIERYMTELLKEHDVPLDDMHALIGSKYFKMIKKPLLYNHDEDIECFREVYDIVKRGINDGL